MADDTLTITDNRTGKTYTLPLYNDAIRAIDLRQIKTGPDDFGLLSYDPAFLNTASCQSAITYLDGDRGILRYRGYPIEELAEGCSFLEVAYLLLNGELPSPDELDGWMADVTRHTMIHENLKKFMEGFHYDAHPMGMLMSTVAALSTFYPEARNIHDPTVRKLQITRLIGKMPTLTAYSYRHSLGLPYVYPDNDLGYTKNFMNMLWKRTEPKFSANPVLARALEVLFILHADHEQNCSTSAMRAVGSSFADPYATTAAAIAALSGPLHGGANEEVLRMLDEIGSKARVPAYIEQIKAGHGKLMGFGHRVYKNYDPRARIIKRVAEEVFEVTGRNPKLDIALELERIALEDDFFIKRKLYPNVDFYSGIIYQAMGFSPDVFTVLFAIPRAVGWLAQWQEMLKDGEQKIARPRQLYTGQAARRIVRIEERNAQAAGLAVAAAAR
ncbi:MAG TPA: citrate synthase [Bryobacteraceae bacterium]|jgi:citrate synthase|nr:citrate synthase [Bryobacteraceae bacterium]